MFNPGEFAIITANNESIKSVMADLQLKKGQKVKIMKIYPDSWVVVEGLYNGMPCNADIPMTFLEKQ